MKMKLYYGALALLWLLSSCTPSSNVTDNHDKVGTCFDIEVEADSEDEAWEKAYDTVDLGDLEVRDCEYSDDEITLLEE